MDRSARRARSRGETLAPSPRERCRDAGIVVIDLDDDDDGAAPASASRRGSSAAPPPPPLVPAGAVAMRTRSRRLVMQAAVAAEEAPRRKRRRKGTSAEAADAEGGGGSKRAAALKSASKSASIGKRRGRSRRASEPADGALARKGKEMEAEASPQPPPPPPPASPAPVRPASIMAAALWTLVVAVAVAGRGCWCGEAAATAAETAHEALRAHGLPRGLLPAGIAEFRHDAGSGRFEAALEAACTARFEVGLRYNATVAGVISYGRIAALSGVSAKDLFLWFPVRGIRVDVPSSGVIYFDVGVVFKHFPLTAFEAPPPCTPDPFLLLTSQQRRDDGDVDGSVAGGAALQ